jgi:CHAT domain-containing protein
MESAMLQRVRTLREELNWFYSQMHRSDFASSAAPARLADLQKGIRDRERGIQDTLRQLQQLSPERVGVFTPRSVSLEDLQSDLGASRALIEYFVLDDEVLAFVVTDERIEVVRTLATRQAVEAAVSQFQFQLRSLRGGSSRVRAHLPQLTGRVRHHLTALHQMLLEPVESRIGLRGIVVVPHDILHYVPFHALFDGSAYTIERREVSYAPSASVLEQCLRTHRRPFDRALFVGVPDEEIPRVRDEVLALSKLFQDPTTLIGEAATRAAVRDGAKDADLLHLACHGKFRPDNPLFSALRLGDGWLTVREAYDLDLHGRLVTLSACETGLSSLGPGDELTGLVRGFFSAGCPTLLVSLWAVDDDSTRDLMQEFYTRLRDGESPVAALRAAQRTALETYQHPYFWAPFAVFGRW